MGTEHAARWGIAVRVGDVELGTFVPTSAAVSAGCRGSCVGRGILSGSPGPPLCGGGDLADEPGRPTREELEACAKGSARAPGTRSGARSAQTTISTKYAGSSGWAAPWTSGPRLGACRWSTPRRYYAASTNGIEAGTTRGRGLASRGAPAPLLPGIIGARYRA